MDGALDINISRLLTWHDNCEGEGYNYFRRKRAMSQTIDHVKQIAVCLIAVLLAEGCSTAPTSANLARSEPSVIRSTFGDVHSTQGETIKFSGGVQPTPVDSSVTAKDAGKTVAKVAVGGVALAGLVVVAGGCVVVLPLCVALDIAAKGTYAAGKGIYSATQAQAKKQHAILQDDSSKNPGASRYSLGSPVVAASKM